MDNSQLAALTQIAKHQEKALDDVLSTTKELVDRTVQIEITLATLANQKERIDDNERRIRAVETKSEVNKVYIASWAAVVGFISSTIVAILVAVL